LTLYLLKQVISIIDSKGIEILKGNEFIITLSHNIKAEASFKVKGAFVPNTNKARGRANILKRD
jgi:hypothetical protein